MLWIGLTGGIATGKSTVTKILRAQHIAVVCADEVSHEVVQKGTPALAQIQIEFGDEVITPDGSLDRKRLGQLVFADKQKLRRLEAIIHPQVRARVAQLRSDLTQSKRHAVSFYDIPLLFEKSMQEDFDAIVVVTCDPAQQIARAKLRDRLPEAEVERRIAAQWPIREKAELAGFVIDNSKDLPHLEKEVERMMKWVKTVKPRASASL